MPAFQPCDTPSSNANHDPSLPGRSCNPAVPSSSLVAPGPNGIGFQRLIVLQPGQCPPFDPSHCYPDVSVRVMITDVHAGSPTGPLFSGSLTATLPDTSGAATVGDTTQRTDARNSLDTTNGACVAGTYDCSATVVKTPIPFSVTCINGACNAQTAFNAGNPGYVIVGKRDVAEWGQVQILDSASHVFEVQGIDIP